MPTALPTCTDTTGQHMGQAVRYCTRILAARWPAYPWTEVIEALDAIACLSAEFRAKLFLQQGRATTHAHAHTCVAAHEPAPAIVRVPSGGGRTSSNSSSVNLSWMYHVSCGVSRSCAITWRMPGSVAHAMTSDPRHNSNNRRATAAEASPALDGKPGTCEDARHLFGNCGLQQVSAALGGVGVPRMQATRWPARPPSYTHEWRS